jgi:hypothetical protein
MCQELAGSLCGAAAANVEGSMLPENCSVSSGGVSSPTPYIHSVLLGGVRTSRRSASRCDRFDRGITP